MEILEIGHFQFVTGLLQFAAGLHAGFALTDSFRNLPKKKFDQFASNWKRISDPETSNTGIKKISAEEKVRSYVADINADGDLVAQKKAKLSLKWAVWLFGFSAVLSLLPLPIFSPVNWALFASYVFFLLLIIREYQLCMTNPD